MTAPADALVEAPVDEPALVLRLTEPCMDGWSAIEERGRLRVLVVEDRTRFFIAEGRARGFELELMVELGRYLNERAEREGRPRVDVAFVPVPFDQLLPALLEGRGDVAAAGLTATSERRERVDFTEPYLRDVAQVVVAHAEAPPVATLDDLAGRSVCVVLSTSYAESLARLNEDLTRRGLEPLEVISAGRGLVTEDVLELVHAGAFEYTIADRHIARLWSGVLDDLLVLEDVVLEEKGELAWAVRQSNPELKRVLDGFVRENRKGTLIGNILFERYFETTRWIRDPLPDVRESLLAQILEPLQRLSDEHGFDWRLIAAQAYQESRLDPKARSAAGAIGLMQVLPSTAADMGVEDLLDPESNLEAGIRYMAWLRDTYFDDPALPAPVRVDFTLAAYNAGPARVRRWRQQAPARGVDPDLWFGQVERLALDEVGFEPVRYVGNVNKYFVVLARVLELRQTKQEALQAIGAQPVR